jgi:hypothetical protein
MSFTPSAGGQHCGRVHYGMSAAHYTKELINTKYGALCYQQMLSKSGGEQDAALQEEINQYETLLRAIRRHTVAMGLAAKRK